MVGEVEGLPRAPRIHHRSDNDRQHSSRPQMDDFRGKPFLTNGEHAERKYRHGLGSGRRAASTPSA
jgi:hypothetical protein